MEDWKTAKGMNGKYEVSDLGRIRHAEKSNILKPWLNIAGYQCITFQLNGKGKNVKVHKIVAETFLNHTPNGMNEVVDHINRNKLDNRLENLRVVSQRENSLNRTDSKPNGVRFDKRNKRRKWICFFNAHGKQLYIGSFVCELAAIVAHNHKKKEYEQRF